MVLFVSICAVHFLQGKFHKRTVFKEIAAAHDSELKHEKFSACKLNTLGLQAFSRTGFGL